MSCSDKDEIVGWIFRCDLCGFDERIEEKDWKLAICKAQGKGWKIRVEERTDRCPKCAKDEKK